MVVYVTEEEGRNHPKKNIITRALGTARNVVVDIFKINKNKFKVFLLCSDGLTNEVSKEEVFNIIKNSKDLNNASNDLISLANEQGEEIILLSCYLEERCRDDRDDIRR